MCWNLPETKVTTSYPWTKTPLSPSLVKRPFSTIFHNSEDNTPPYRKPRVVFTFSELPSWQIQQPVASPKESKYYPKPSTNKQAIIIKLNLLDLNMVWGWPSFMLSFLQVLVPFCQLFWCFFRYWWCGFTWHSIQIQWACCWDSTKFSQLPLTFQFCIWFP